MPALLWLACARVAAPPEPTVRSLPVAEASITELQTWMADGTLTSQELVGIYLDRIERYEPTLRAAISVRADALAEAAALDRERAAGTVRGPLHGIPLALKDNIHTTGMPTTAGAVAFADLAPPYEATLVRNLREAGAIVLAKTTLTELANWMASGMPDGYNAVSGFSMNPYDPRSDPRPDFDDGRPVLSPGGSSSGVGAAAGLWTASVGTETSGSIAIPSNYNMLVGIKPTLGRISRHGIVPIVAEQDTAGPMARHVEDAALLLAALEGSGPDPHDPATGRCAPPAGGDYTTSLSRDGLVGARIGVPRAYFYDAVTPPGERAPRGGISALGKALMQAAIETLREAGATIVDPVVVPSIVDPDPGKNVLRFPPCAGDNPRGRDADCSIVMKYGMKRDFNAWLESLGERAPVASLTELRAFNREHAEDLGTMAYGQAVLDVCDEMDLERDRERFERDRERDLFLTREHGLDVPLAEHDLDALLIPSWLGETLHSRSGYPAVSVPFALIPNRLDPPAPEGFQPRPLPNGVTFTGPACSEQRLLELAYAFEQATLRRIPPPEFP